LTCAPIAKAYNAVAVAEKNQMVMAGLWDEWTDKKTGERVKSCTIITCPTNALIGTLHDRMPAILAEANWAKWLGEASVYWSAQACLAHDPVAGRLGRLAVFALRARAGWRRV
jgi:putative SOS response-associated peptidase YedK